MDHKEYLKSSGLNFIGKFLVRVPAFICWPLLILWPLIFLISWFYHSVFNLFPEIFKELSGELVMLKAQRQNYRFLKKS